jgi:DNA repair protein RadC
LGALYLNARNHLIAEREVYRGTLSRMVVEPRVIIKEALLRSACSMVLFHTHPSGDPNPSMEDLEFTRRMLEAGKLLNIRLLDHLILGAHGRWVSLARRGAF